jgi:hypothetical protein
MAAQSFKEMTNQIDQFRFQSIFNNTSPLTQKYLNKLLFEAAQRGEAWAL